MLVGFSLVCGRELHLEWMKNVVWAVVLGFRLAFSLHVAVSKRSNFQAEGCVWVGLTRGGVEKE